MSLVRIPRLWEKRHYYHEWKTLNENRNLDEDDALELFKHEERRWNLYEDELRNQIIMKARLQIEGVYDIHKQAQAFNEYIANHDLPL